MIADAKNSELYPEWLGYIQSEQTRDAFRYFVGLASELEEYICYPEWHGKYRDFRFFDSHGEQPFAFGLAKSWLLFYFRPPAIRTNRYNFQDIRNEFDTAEQKDPEKWTVKLKSIEDVRKIWKLLKIDN